MNEREPDVEQDPRGKDTGEGGYAEEQPGDATPGEGQGPSGREAAEEAEDAPDTSSPGESDPGKATGNPDAAG